MAISTPCSMSTSTKLMPGVVGTMPDHHEGVAVIAEELRPAVVGQDLEQDDPVGLAAAEDGQELGVASATG